MDNCPKCGGDRDKNQQHCVFRCGTRYLEAIGESCQSDTCRIAELTAEVERLERVANFGEKAVAEVKECIANGGYEVECEVIADIAVACGLMVQVPYDPDKHGTDPPLGDCDPGDIVYFWGKEES
jgi:hypothetical protein